MNQDTVNMIIGLIVIVVFIYLTAKGVNLWLGCLGTFLIVLPISLVVRVLFVSAQKAAPYIGKVLIAGILIVIALVSIEAILRLRTKNQVNSKLKKMTEGEREINEEGFDEAIKQYKKQIKSLPREEAYTHLIENLRKDKVVYYKSELDTITEDINKEHEEQLEKQKQLEAVKKEKLEKDHIAKELKKQKSKEYKELNKLEDFLFSSEVRPYTKGFILTTTYQYDKGLISPEEHVQSHKDFIRLLKHKTLIKTTSSINRVYLNQVIGRRKYDFYIKSFKEQLHIYKTDTKDQVINKYVTYYGNESDDKYNIILLGKVLKEPDSIVTKKVEEATRKLKEDYKMKRLEGELLGGQHLDTIEYIDTLSGYEFEDYLGEMFESFGYQVERTGYSGDYGADLIIKSSSDKIVIQAKNYTGNVGLEAVQQALAAKAHYNCNIAMVITNSSYTKAAKELSKTTRVILVDRSELEKIIRGGRLHFSSLY